MSQDNVIKKARRVTVWQARLIPALDVTLAMSFGRCVLAPDFAGQHAAFVARQTIASVNHLNALFNCVQYDAL